MNDPRAARAPLTYHGASMTPTRPTRHHVPAVLLIAACLSAGWVSPVRAEEGAPVSGDAPVSHHSLRPFHASVGSGVFLPWDGDRGTPVSVMFHRGFGSDRFWVGGEVEFRHFEGDVKPYYRPEYDNYGVRFQFQYHPFPKAIVSPYVGIGVGFVVNTVENGHANGNPADKVRSDVSGGTTLLGLAGFELAVPFVPWLEVFAEGRLENASDLWRRKGGNYQLDQVGGFTGMGGLRVRWH